MMMKNEKKSEKLFTLKEKSKPDFRIEQNRESYNVVFLYHQKTTKTTRKSPEKRDSEREREREKIKHLSSHLEILLAKQFIIQQ